MRGLVHASGLVVGQVQASEKPQGGLTRQTQPINVTAQSAPGSMS